MPPVRQRPLEDSRSETSSTVTNIKDRSGLNQTLTSAIIKGRKVITGPVNGVVALPKPVVNGNVAISTEHDPNLPRVSRHICSSREPLREDDLLIFSLADRLAQILL